MTYQDLRFSVSRGLSATAEFLVKRSHACVQKKQRIDFTTQKDDGNTLTGAPVGVWHTVWYGKQELSYRKQIACQLRTLYVEGINSNPVTL